MTIQELAQREGVSERQVQRYCKVGFQGHVLPAVKLGKAFHIEESDYAAWRVACGFEQAQQVTAPSEDSSERPAPSSPRDERPSVSPGDTHPPYPPFPMPADPNGIPTNCPHEHSCTHPHPLAVQEFMKQEAEKLREKYRGPHVED